MSADKREAAQPVDRDAKLKERKDAKLDDAIEDTFPASDPLATGCPTGDDTNPGARVDRKTPRVDAELVERLAEDVRRKTIDTGTGA